jgi:hypothetical protein
MGTVDAMKHQLSPDDAPSVRRLRQAACLRHSRARPASVLFSAEARAFFVEPDTSPIPRYSK